MLQKALGEVGRQECDQRTCLCWWICPLATMAATQQTPTEVAERQSNTGHTKLQYLLYPHLSMLAISDFTTVLTGTDSLWKKEKNNHTKPNKANISLFLLITPNNRHKKEFSQRLKLQDQVLQLQHQLEVQRQSCLQVRKITLSLKHASSVPLHYAIIAMELTFLQKQISTDLMQLNWIASNATELQQWCKWALKWPHT